MANFNRDHREFQGEGNGVKQLMVSAAAVLVGVSTAAAGSKRGYTLFNPTPDSRLRDMTTDRPDATESPFTIDAGHVQIETNLYGFSRAHRDIDGSTGESHEIGTTNIRIGLTNDAEINFVWQPYGQARTKLSGAIVDRQSGAGSVDIRGKINLWGNDTMAATGSALALLPFVTLPTDRNNGISAEHVEGGLIVPLALELPNRFGLGLNGGVVWSKDDARRRYRAQYLATASLAYEWTDRLGSYYELAVTFNTGDPRADTAAFVGTGVTYAVTDNIQLDAGVNIGITDSADRINPIVGVSQRF